MANKIRYGGAARLEVTDMAVYTTPRHPDFDECWEKNHRLVYYWAYRLAWIVARMFKQSKLHTPWRAEDFLGYLTLRLNYTLTNWKPEFGALTTIFCMHIVQHTLRMVVWVDREGYNRKDKDTKAALEAYAWNKGQRYHLYRTPEDVTWEEQMLELLGDDPWTALTRTLPPRYKQIVEYRFRDGKTLRETGELLDPPVTRERVRQLEVKIMTALRRRIEKLEPARRLFFGDLDTYLKPEEVRSEA